MMQSEHTPILSVRGLSKSYLEPEKNSLFSRAMNHAVQGVSFELYRGETLGIVGESGCGKSTVARLVMGLEKPDAGSVLFHDARIDQLPESSLRALRPRFQMVFQDSGFSLNSRKRVVDILREPMLYHRIVCRDQVDARIDELLNMVGLSPSAKLRYPHEFSGGQRQRICIAKALSLDPELIILDEPVSALDVSVQAQILNLLRDLQERLGISYLFIGHGLGAVHYISHRIAVMYRGRIVEMGESEELFRHPVHPYTRALLDAAPLADYDARERKRIVLRGEIGHTDWTEGCAFRSRCPYATSQCTRASCTMTAAESPMHVSACMAGTQERGDDLRRYVIKKILLAILVLLGITIIDYLLMSLAGNPLDMMAGPRVTQDAIAFKAEKLGLDQPFIVQYFTWLGQVLQGNLGYSYKSYEAVSKMIGSHIAPTLLLMGMSMLVAFLIAIPVGIYSAVHRYQKRDFAVVTASFVGSSVPSFFLALILIYIFNVRLGWLPSSGMETPGTGGDFLDVARHMVMPVLMLAAGYFGGWVDQLIMSVTDMVMSFPYILLVLVAAAIFEPGMWSIILILGFVDWPGVTRLVRGNVLSLRETNFFKGDIAAGMPRRYILFSEVLPNTIAPVLVYATSVFAISILDEAALSYLGMGVQLPTPSLGNLLNGAESISILTGKPWLWLPAGVLIIILVVCIYLIGDALRDVMDPRNTERG